MLKRVENWIKKLPKHEDELPLVVFGRRAYTPREILATARERPILGSELMSMVERRISTEIEEELEELAVLRIKEKQRRWPTTVMVMTPEGPVELTSEGQIEAVEKRTPIGMWLIRGEISYIKRLWVVYGA